MIHTRQKTSRHTCLVGFIQEPCKIQPWLKIKFETLVILNMNLVVISVTLTLQPVVDRSLRTKPFTVLAAPHKSSHANSNGVYFWGLSRQPFILYSKVWLLYYRCFVQCVSDGVSGYYLCVFVILGGSCGLSLPFQIICDAENA